MEQLVLAIVLAAVEHLPKLIDGIEKSATMSAEEKRAALTLIRTKLDATAARVAAVQFL